MLILQWKNTHTHTNTHKHTHTLTTQIQHTCAHTHAHMYTVSVWMHINCVGVQVHVHAVHMDTHIYSFVCEYNLYNGLGSLLYLRYVLGIVHLSFWTCAHRRQFLPVTRVGTHTHTHTHTRHICIHTCTHQDRTTLYVTSTCTHVHILHCTYIYNKSYGHAIATATRGWQLVEWVGIK